MSVSVEKLENSMACLTIEVPVETFEAAVEKVYKKNRGNIRMDGFRKGKAPRAMIEKVYGPEIFFEEAANDVIGDTYPDAVDECGEDVVSSPEIKVTQIEKGKPFIYTATVALKPPVSLGKYKGVSVEKSEPVEVKDEEVEAEVNREREKNASIETVTDRPVKDGDMIILDYEGFTDGVPFDGGKGEDQTLTIGSGSFIPGFEEQLVGAAIGEEKEISVTFPEQYHAEELKGKAAVFKCTVKSIREKILPEADDEFAQDVSGKDLKEWKEEIREKLLKNKEKKAQTEKENAVIDEVVKDAAIDIPPAMLETQKRQMLEEFGQSMRMQGLTLEQYMQFTGQTPEKVMEGFSADAEKRIRTRLTLEEIVKAEGIEATEEDLEKEFAKMAENYRTEVETIKSMFATEREKNRLKEDIAVQKAIDFVTENAKETKKKKEKKDAE